MKKPSDRILVVDDEQDICRALEFLLSRDGYDVATAHSAERALELMDRWEYSLVLTDLKMDGMDGLAFIDEAGQRWPETTFAVMTAFASVENAVEVMKHGAADYIVKPFVNDDVRLTVKRLLDFRRLERENRMLRRELSTHIDESRFLGTSPQVRQMFAVLEKVIPTKSNILLLGESGTGKGVVAEIVHYNSPRRDKPFMSINCSAIPETLLESELFGYRKGAFTGANADKMGLIEAADGGTVFLDEIGDMPLTVQTKVLKVLEQGEVMPLGGTKTRQVDIRLVAATNRKLAEAIRSGEFREDLYYRLNVIELTIPPLRERREDIALMVQSFVQSANERHGTKIAGVDDVCMSALMEYPWPGNVRELRNVIERAVLLSPGPEVSLRDLPEKILSDAGTAGGDSLKSTLDFYEKQVILKRLAATGWQKDLTARDLGIDLATLYRKMKKLGIEK